MLSLVFGLVPYAFRLFYVVARAKPLLFMLFQAYFRAFAVINLNTSMFK
jgi:hypothetical protein